MFFVELRDGRDGGKQLSMRSRTLWRLVSCHDRSEVCSKFPGWKELSETSAVEGWERFEAVVGIPVSMNLIRFVVKIVRIVEIVKIVKIVKVVRVGKVGKVEAIKLMVPERLGVLVMLCHS